MTSDAVIIRKANVFQLGRAMTEAAAEQTGNHRSVAVSTQVEKTYHMDSLSVPVIKGVDISSAVHVLLCCWVHLEVAKRPCST